MTEYLTQLDYDMFMFINQSLQNPVTDFVMPLITNDWFLRVLYLVGMLAVLWKGNARLRWMVLFSVIVLFLTDQLTATYLKEWIGRLRPCQSIDINFINLLVDNCGGGESMPSAHAANAFGQAVFWSFFDKTPRVYLYIFAFLVAISRVFVGVHYPFDVIVGSLVGACLGVMIAVLFAFFKIRVIERK